MIRTTTRGGAGSRSGQGLGKSARQRVAGRWTIGRPSAERQTAGASGAERENRESPGLEPVEYF